MVIDPRLSVIALPNFLRSLELHISSLVHHFFFHCMRDRSQEFSLGNEAMK